MANTKKEYGRIKIPVSIGVERGLIEEFDRVCQDAGVSRSTVVAQLMKDFIGNGNRKRKNSTLNRD